MQQIKPLILRTDEIRDLLAGRAVVRREMKHVDRDWQKVGVCNEPDGRVSCAFYNGYKTVDVFAPYRPGQTVYVREVWGSYWEPSDSMHFMYRADWPEGAKTYWFEPEHINLCDLPQWRSPAFMPREACRLWGTVESVRPERTDAGWNWVNEGVRAERPEGWE